MLNAKELDEDFESRIKRDASCGDKESDHIEADAILCELLILLGFERTVAAYRLIEKWYA